MSYNKLKDLDVLSVHFVDDPAVEDAKFLIKKSKNPEEVKQEEVKEETEKEEVAKSFEKDFKKAIELLMKVKDKLPDEVKKLIDKLKDYSYGEIYPEPTKKSKEVEEVLKAKEQVEKELEEVKKSYIKLKVETWANDWIAKGITPAMVEKAKEKVLENVDLMDSFNEIFENAPKIQLDEVKGSEVSKGISETEFKKIAKIAAEGGAE